MAVNEGVSRHFMGYISCVRYNLIEVTFFLEDFYNHSSRMFFKVIYQ